MEKKISNQSPDGKSKIRFDLEQRKVVLSASLVSIIVVLSVFNQNLFRPEPDAAVVRSNGRGIASVENPQELQAQVEWEYRLAKQLAPTGGEGERDMASIGQMPSAMEQFRFGFLENKYQFNFKDGKVMGLHFPETSPDRPKYITEGKAFLMDHSKLFTVAFKSAKEASREASEKATTETFNLLDQESKQVGKAILITDQYGRLLSLEVNGL